MTESAQAAAGLLAALIVAVAALMSAGLIVLLLPALRRHALAKPLPQLILACIAPHVL